MSEENTPEHDRAERLRLGCEWLRRIFGNDSVSMDKLGNSDVISINCTKLLRQGCNNDDVIQWLDGYLRSKGATQAKVFTAPETGHIMMMADSFNQVGLVSALASLHFELAEHMLEKEFPRPRNTGLSEAAGPSMTVDEFVQQLSDSMDGIPVEMQAFIQQLRDSQEPKPKAQPVTPKIAIPVLEEATGVRWKECTIGSVRCYSTTNSYANRDELSSALRSVLRGGNRDLPDFKLSDNKLTIPATYIDGGNFGALLESKPILYPTFTGRQPDQPELP